MKTLLSLAISAILIFFTFDSQCQQDHLDVEGHVKIRGRIDINHMNDTTSVIIGRNAGVNTDFLTRRFNTFVGSNAGLQNTSGNDNSFYGSSAGQNNTIGFFNSFFGRFAGYNNVAGFANSFFGRGAGQNNTMGSANSFFGSDSGFNNLTGNNNSFFGSTSGFTNETGNNNSFFGNNTGVNNSTGNDNSFFGQSSGHDNSTGDANSFYGTNSGVSNRTGNSNSFFGKNTGINNTTGYNNSFFGQGAGNKNSNGTNNTCIGYSADLKTIGDSLNRAIAIGYFAQVDCSNCAVIGGTNDNAVNVGIGTDSPSGALHILKEGSAPLGLPPGQNGLLLGLDSINGAKWIQSYGGALAINSKGNFVGIGTSVPDDALDVFGDIDATGCIQTGNSGSIGGFCLSDKRLKKNIRSLDAQLTKILSLNPVKFEWKNTGINGGKALDIGLIAQEVEKVIPDMVVTDEDGYKRIRYDISLQLRMIKAIQEQHNEITELREQIAEIDHLKKEMAELRTLLRAQSVQSDGEE